MKWVFIMWIATNQGYITVPGIVSEPACHDFARRFIADAIGYDRRYACLSYQTEKAVLL